MTTAGIQIPGFELLRPLGSGGMSTVYLALQRSLHRDLKPANIMFRDSGTPVLTDFGIARYQDGTATRLTQTGMLVGTPTYMSPEQVNGDAVDGRADLYSLGVLFYELLAGVPPFR